MDSSTHHPGINLHIGGHQPCEGWVILNAQAGPHVDVVGDVSDLSNFDDDSCARIYCSHVLEHVPQRQLLDTLKGLHRILRPGGQLYVSVPDLDVLCHLMLSPRLNADDKYLVMRVMFGGQVDDFDYHKVGLNLSFLSSFLEEAGFTRMEQVERFELFDDSSGKEMFGVPISLNVIVEK